MKKYILLDHDGVLVDTGLWYYKAGERALADIGFTLDQDQYLRDMTQTFGTWSQARAGGIDEQTISRQCEVRNVYYQEYLKTQAIEMLNKLLTACEKCHYETAFFAAISVQDGLARILYAAEKERWPGIADMGEHREYYIVTGIQILSRFWIQRILNRCV